MSASKELFLKMRPNDLAVMYDENFTKSKAIETGKKLVDDLFEFGEVDEKKVFSNIVRFKEVFNSADKALRDRIDFKSTETINGVEFIPKNGSKSLNYNEDPIYVELIERVKERELLLKTAKTSKETIFDGEGIEVPRVSESYSKSSITVKF